MTIIKLRGLPWSCTNDDVIRFLDGVRILQTSGKDTKNNNDCQYNGIKIKTELVPAIYLMNNSEGRPSGEAFVEIELDDLNLELALQKNNALMGQRYIEGIH
jgi:heterogeneous nuclear ribonucleoprotein F/H